MRDITFVCFCVCGMQVLRLWVERKIFPESVLRRYMDDIEVSNDDMTVSFSLKHPSRAEGSLDDPIREMEGMLVDLYGRCGIYSYHCFIRLEARALCCTCICSHYYVFLVRVSGDLYSLTQDNKCWVLIARKKLQHKKTQLSNCCFLFYCYFYLLSKTF